MATPKRAATRIFPRNKALMAAVIALVMVAAGSLPVHAAGDAPVRVLRIRHFSGPEHTRVVIDLDRGCSWEARRVEGPDRVAVNLAGAVFAGGGDRQVNDGLVQRIRCNAGDGRAQVVIDLDGRREFRAFSLPPVGDRPERVVIDIVRSTGSLPPVAELAAAPAPVPGGSESAAAGSGAADAPPEAAGTPAGGDAPGAVAGEAVAGEAVEVAAAAASRVVPLVDDDSAAGGTSGPAAGEVPAGGEPLSPGSGAASAPVVAEASPSESPSTPVSQPAEQPAPAAADEPFVVVIDPGHGGDDPGAIRGSLEEKDIVLDIGREVARQLGKLPGYRVVLTRDRDRFLALGKRVEVARREKGDVFVSIHCNTHPRPAVSGMEVYFLSLQGATDREARELADKENAAGLVGLAPGENHADLVVDILMDLKMTRVLQDSGRLAASLLTAADRSGVVAGRRVKQAGFQVLKNLAMPSALVEVAYLSNQDDYRLLGDAAGRQRLAAAIVAGIQDWRAGSAPARPKGVVVAAAPPAAGERWETVYRVRSGDSLWKLADRYGTTMSEIARRNNLSDRQRELRIGQRLRLPGVGGRQ